MRNGWNESGRQVALSLWAVWLLAHIIAYLLPDFDAAIKAIAPPNDKAISFRYCLYARGINSTATEDPNYPASHFAENVSDLLSYPI